MHVAPTQAQAKTLCSDDKAVWSSDTKFNKKLQGHDDKRSSDTNLTKKYRDLVIISKDPQVLDRVIMPRNGRNRRSPQNPAFPHLADLR
eukprot:c25151_g1_i1 orf=53-319(-)